MGIKTSLDLATWPRRDHFEHFMRASPCTWAVTVEVDVTALVARLRESPRKSYLAQIWMLSTVVNRHEEFRMTLDEDDGPAVWDVVHPFFTVLNAKTETFSTLWAEYDPDFGSFHDRVLPLLAEYRSSTSYAPQRDVPENTFDVSSVPWMPFTSLELQIKDPWRYLAPIFTIGRYVEQEGKTLMPLAIQAHHAAVDGFHAARLVSGVSALAANPSWLG